MENNTNKNFFKGITRAVLRKSILSYAIIGIAGIINVVILNSFLQQGRPGTPVLVFSILEAAVLVAIFTWVSVKSGEKFAHSVSEPIGRMASAANSIAKGNLDADVPDPCWDGMDGLADGLKKIAASVQCVKTGTDFLAGKVADGQLDYELDLSRCSGEYRAIIENMNRTVQQYRQVLKRPDCPPRQKSRTINQNS